MCSEKNAKSFSTPYDDACRTMMERCQGFLYPIVNLAFGEHYTGEEELIRKANEFGRSRPDGTQSRRIKDSWFEIRGTSAEDYHMECESAPGNNLPERMFEYDVGIAIIGAMALGNRLTVKFPRSMLLCLRHSSQTPDHLETRLVTGGGSLDYRIPVIRLQEFDLEAILEKKLYFFLPFYIFRFEKSFGKMEEDAGLMEPMLTALGDIFDALYRLCDEKLLNFYERCTVQDMLELVAEAVTGKYPAVQKGVMKFMGGKVVEGRWMRRYEEVSRQGMQQGMQRGIQQGIQQGKQQGMQQGMQQGIRALINTCSYFGVGYESTRDRLMSEYSLSQAEADVHMKQYWKEPSEQEHRG